MSYTQKQKSVRGTRHMHDKLTDRDLDIVYKVPFCLDGATDDGEAIVNYEKAAKALGYANTASIRAAWNLIKRKLARNSEFIAANSYVVDDNTEEEAQESSEHDNKSDEEVLPASTGAGKRKASEMTVSANASPSGSNDPDLQIISPVAPEGGDDRDAGGRLGIFSRKTAKARVIKTPVSKKKGAKKEAIKMEEEVEKEGNSFWEGIREFQKHLRLKQKVDSREEQDDKNPRMHAGNA
ncbi:hypothetical protein F4825DRAFT_456618 [Nemania diffusa]|nr:hypothetical protein F4825DRAFT_456618 [Nemania diffusa]